jgi:hypothetical protein
MTITPAQADRTKLRRLAMAIAAGIFVVGLFTAVTLRGGAQQAETRVTSDKPAALDVRSPRRVRGGEGEDAKTGIPKFQVARTPDGPKYRSGVSEWLAQSRGPGYREPSDYFSKQERTEPWASAMEANLTQRFSTNRLREAGLTTMKLDALECRENACRLEVSWGEEDVAVAKQTRPDGKENVWPNAFAHFKIKTGPLAEIEVRDNPRLGEVVVPNTYRTIVRADGRYAVYMTVLFGEGDIDPASYDAFVARARTEQKAKL